MKQLLPANIGAVNEHRTVGLQFWRKHRRIGAFHNVTCAWCLKPRAYGLAIIPCFDIAQL